jgi:hypothetical protein
MNRKIWSMVICAVFLVAAGACSKHHSAAQVIVEIPSGFTGNFLLEMGISEAPPLAKRGDAYVVPVPRNGKVITSTLLTKSRPTFRNSSEGAVWGYSHSVFTTGDGIPTGGTIEFFVGTRKEYEAEQGKKNHSGGLSTPAELIASGA